MPGKSHQGRKPRVRAIKPWALLVAAVGLGGAALNALPAQTLGASARWIVSLETKERCEPSASCPAGVSWLFNVRNRATSAVTRFKLVNKMEQLADIRVTPGDTAAILGRVGRFGPPGVVAVVTLPGGRVTDTFTCVLPTFSPDNRFLAFRKWFPEHLPRGVLPNDEYLVYDLTESLGHNRRSCKTKPHCGPGQPVYPPGAVNAPGLNAVMGSAMEQAHLMASAGFFWLNGDTVAFVDRWHDVNRLVVANLSAGIHHPRVAVRKIGNRRLVDFATCTDKVAPSDLEKWKRDPGTLIYVREIQKLAAKPGWVRLALTPNPCLSKTTLDLPIGRKTKR